MPSALLNIQSVLVGRDDKEIERIYVALDAGDEVIAEAARWGADLSRFPKIYSHSAYLGDSP